MKAMGIWNSPSYKIPFFWIIFNLCNYSGRYTGRLCIYDYGSVLFNNADPMTIQGFSCPSTHLFLSCIASSLTWWTIPLNSINRLVLLLTPIFSLPELFLDPLWRSLPAFREPNKEFCLVVSSYIYRMPSTEYLQNFQKAWKITFSVPVAGVMTNEVTHI